MQLDIFDDSRDVWLRNGVLDALERRDLTGARAAAAKLCDEFPHDGTLACAAVLIDALGSRGGANFAEHGSMHAARIELRDAVLPAAVRLFGAQAGATWLIPLWREVAKRAARLPFRADRSEDHAAPLWLVAGDWASAALAAAGVESWRRIPAPLSWMAEACWRRDGLDAVWPLLVELAWLAPARFGDVARRLADPAFDKLRKRFDLDFEGDGSISDLAWLPAWVLADTPALAPLLAQAHPSRQEDPERAMRLMVELLGLERQGRHHELIERRRSLRDLQPALYAAYMKTR